MEIKGKKSSIVLAVSFIIRIFATATTNLKSYTQMKQVLFMAVLAVGMLLTGCSKDSENNGMEFTLNASSISLLAHDDYKIIPSGAFIAMSNNDDVATVSSDGTIHAVSAGNADIIFTSVENPTLTQTCKVNVDWRYKYFDEPILDFGATPEQIKEHESHTLASDDILAKKDTIYDRECDRIIIYRNRETVIETDFHYCFAENKLVCIYVAIRNNWIPKETPNKIAQQLTERYGSPTEVTENFSNPYPEIRDDAYNKYTFISDKKNFRIVCWFIDSIKYFPL